MLFNHKHGHYVHLATRSNTQHNNNTMSVFYYPLPLAMLKILLTYVRGVYQCGYIYCAFSLNHKQFI